MARQGIAGILSQIQSLQAMLQHQRDSVQIQIGNTRRTVLAEQKAKGQIADPMKNKFYCELTSILKEIDKCLNDTKYFLCHYEALAPTASRVQSLLKRLQIQKNVEKEQQAKEEQERLNQLDSLFQSTDEPMPGPSNATGQTPLLKRLQIQQTVEKEQQTKEKQERLDQLGSLFPSTNEPMPGQSTATDQSLSNQEYTEEELLEAKLLEAENYDSETEKDNLKM